MGFREWSFGRVAAVAFACTVAAILAGPGRAFFFMWADGEKGGLAGVSFDLLSLVACVLLPPLILFTAWLIMRRRRHD